MESTTPSMSFSKAGCRFNMGFLAREVKVVSSVTKVQPALIINQGTHPATPRYIPKKKLGQADQLAGGLWHEWLCH
eukprot:8122055-Alexandrium_andersonii.AAC.1